MSDFGQVVTAPGGRFEGIERPHSAQDVLKLRGSCTSSIRSPAAVR